MIILSPLHVEDCLLLIYYRETDLFRLWCMKHRLTLNTNKTKEMIFDARAVRIHDPSMIENCAIEQVGHSSTVTTPLML